MNSSAGMAGAAAVAEPTTEPVDSPIDGGAGGAGNSMSVEVPDPDVTDAGVPPINVPALALIVTSPENTATTVDPATNIVFTFDGPIQRGSGAVTVTRNDGSLFERIDITSDRVTIADDSLTVDLTSLLGGGALHRIQADASIVEGLNGETPLGLEEPIAFTTAAVALPGGVTAGLHLWLDGAYAPSLDLDEGSVAAWRDRSGRARDYLADGIAPTLATDPFNGHDVPRFAGNSKLSNASGILDTAPIFMVFAVARPSAGDDDNTIWARQHTTISGQDLRVTWGSGANAFYFEAGPSYSTLTAGLPATRIQFTPNVAFLGSSTFELTRGITVRVSGFESYITAPLDPLPAGLPSSIGCLTDGSNDFTGDIAEIVVYDRLLTTEETTLVETALTAKWALGAVSAP